MTGHGAPSRTFWIRGSKLASNHQNRITVTIMPYKDTKRVSRNVEPMGVEETETRTYAPPSRTPLEWLMLGLKSRTHEKSGLLKDKLLMHSLLLKICGSASSWIINVNWHWEIHLKTYVSTKAVMKRKANSSR